MSLDSNFIGRCQYCRKVVTLGRDALRWTGVEFQHAHNGENLGHITCDPIDPVSEIDRLQSRVAELEKENRQVRDDARRLSAHQSLQQSEERLADMIQDTILTKDSEPREMGDFE